MTSGTGVTAPLHENAKFRWTESELPESRPGVEPGRSHWAWSTTVPLAETENTRLLITSGANNGRSSCERSTAGAPGRRRYTPGIPEIHASEPWMGRMKRTQVCTASGAAAAIGAGGGAVPMAVPRVR